MAHAHAVGQRGDGHGRAVVAAQHARHVVGALGLRTDDAHALRLQRQRHAGGQATAADGHDDHVGCVRGQLQAHGALAGDDVGVVEGGQEAVAVHRGQFDGERARFVEAAAVHAHRGAPVRHAGHLGVRRAHGHHGDGLHAQAVCGPGQALGVVAGGGGDDRAAVAAFARHQQGIQGAAHLVRAGALQVLELEPGAEALGVVQRRGRQEAPQARVRGQHVGDADVVLRRRWRALSHRRASASARARASRRARCAGSACAVRWPRARRRSRGGPARPRAAVLPRCR